jgi:cyclic pyranopterin phosphate synthase
MPADFAQWIPGDHLLTAAEIVSVVRIATENGIAEVRLTGGEPLLHPEVVDIVHGIATLPNAPKLSLTTNAIRLTELAKPLKAAGLERVNISLDTLHPDRFLEMTKRDRFQAVLEGIEAAQVAGLSPVKINAVLMRGHNDDEGVDLVRWALSRDLHLRFIEQMPLDAAGIWTRADMISAHDIRVQLEKEFVLTPKADRGSAPAEEFIIDDGPATVGIIASVTAPFCAACDRLRLTADGQLRNCLFSTTETDVREVLRDVKLSNENKADRISALFEATVLTKLPGHGINDPKFVQPLRPMSAIGG